MEYIELNLPKVDSNWLVKDFIYTIKSILLS
jgi:hypothetical protein